MSAAEFLSGICMATFAASGVFFLKFWRAARDHFYLHFCVACWLLAFERIVLSLIDTAHEPIRSSLTEANSWVYLFRLAAFLVILIAVINKNRAIRS